jgi:hypothetical protein
LNNTTSKTALFTPKKSVTLRKRPDFADFAGAGGAGLCCLYRRGFATQACPEPFIGLFGVRALGLRLDAR